MINWDYFRNIGGKNGGYVTVIFNLYLSSPENCTTNRVNYLSRLVKRCSMNLSIKPGNMTLNQTVGRISPGIMTARQGF
jgi:hypothetical protein